MGCCSSPRSTIAGVGILHLMVALGCMGLCGYLLTLDGASLEMVFMDSWSLLTTMHLPVVVDTEGNVIDRENAMATNDRDVAYRTNDFKTLSIQGRSAHDTVNVSVHDDDVTGTDDVSDKRYTTIVSFLASDDSDYDNAVTSNELDDVTVVNSISNENNLEEFTVVNGSENSYNITKTDVIIENATESAFNFNGYLFSSTDEEESHAKSVSGTGTLVNETLSPADEVVANATEISGVDHESNTLALDLSSRLDFRDFATSNGTTEGVMDASSNDTVIISTSFDGDNDTSVATDANVSTVTSDVPSDYTENDVDYTSVLYVEEAQPNLTEINLSSEELQPNVTLVNLSIEEPQPNVTKINIRNEEPQPNVTGINFINEEPQHYVTELSLSNEEPQHNATEINFSNEEPQPNVTEINLNTEETQHNVTEINWSNGVPQHTVTEINFSNEHNGSLIEHHEGRTPDEDEIQTNVDGHFKQVVTEPSISALQTILAESQFVEQNDSLTGDGVVASSTHSVSVANTTLAEALIFEDVVLQQQATSSNQLEPPLVAITTPTPGEETPGNSSAGKVIALATTHFLSADDEDDSNASIPSTADEEAPEPSPSEEESRPHIGALTTARTTHEDAVPNVSALTNVLSTTEETASYVDGLTIVLPTPIEESANASALTTVLPTPKALTALVGSSGFLSTIASALATAVLNSTTETSPSGFYSTPSSSSTLSNVSDPETLPSPTLSSPRTVGTTSSTLPSSDDASSSETVTEFPEPLPSPSALRIEYDASPSEEESRPDIGSLATALTTSEEAAPNVSMLTTVLSTHVEAAPNVSTLATIPSTHEEAVLNVSTLATVPSTHEGAVLNVSTLATVPSTHEEAVLNMSTLATVTSTHEGAVLNVSTLATVTSTHEEAVLNVSTLATVLPTPEEAASNFDPLAIVLPAPIEESNDVGARAIVLPTSEALTALVGSSGFLSTIASSLATAVLDSTTETSPSGSYSSPSSPVTLSNVSDPETLPSPTLSSPSPVGTSRSTPPPSDGAPPAENVTEFPEPLPSPSALRMENDARYSMLASNGSNSVPYVNDNVRDVNTTVEGVTLPPIITTTGFITTILAHPVTDSGSKADAELAHLVRQLQLGLAVLAVLWFAIVCTIAALLLLIAAAMSEPALVVPWLVVQWVAILAAIAGVGILTWRLVVAGVALWCWWLVVLSVAGVVVLVLCLVLVMEAHQAMPSNAARQQDFTDSYEMRYITEK